jgi:anaerobic magnesium-protoporphyrin IX monomethyl ester cyclase
MKKIALVGPELEENLALRYIDAALVEAGHQPTIHDFHCTEQVEEVARAIRADGSDVVGLSMMFTSRSRDFTALAARLRELGYGGHITAGGHFASFHAEQLLRDYPALDSIVHGEGEAAIGELVDHVHELAKVPGITHRLANGQACFQGYRPNDRDLDARPRPTRPASFHRYLGYPIASLLSSRGCYANCDFCSINAWHRQNGGPRFRQRSIVAVADEMAELYHCCGVRIFNFQDDQFFLPTERANLDRLSQLADRLAHHRVDNIALQVKARPDSVTSPVIGALKELGLFRVFLGVESNAVAGLVALGRGISREQNHRALAILRSHEIHTCFNLLMFDPDVELASLRQNIDFIRRQSYFPLNFCRVEVYAGTAIEQRLRTQDRLVGDYLGYTYRIKNPLVQLAYEMFRKVFSPRNFLVEGMNHQAMRVDYYYHLLRRLRPDVVDASLRDDVKGVVAELNQNNAMLLDGICNFAERAPSLGEVTAQTAELSEGRVDFDEALRPRVDALLADMEERSEPKRARPRARVGRVASVVAVGLAASALGCPKTQDTHMAEMAPAEPCYRQPADHPTQQQVHQRIQERYLPGLLSFARARGIYGQNLWLELELMAGGQLSLMTVRTSPTTAGLHEGLTEVVSTWQHDVALQCGSEIVTLELQLVRPGERPPDTHMAEMAPRDPEPLPTGGPYAPNEATLLQSTIQSRHAKELQQLGDDNGLTHDNPVSVAVSLTARGVIHTAHVLSPHGANPRLAAALPSLLTADHYDGFRAGEATVVLRLGRARPHRNPDTHMAEMAPHDPEGY